MSDLDRLFYWRGIAADYLNYRGEHTEVSLENRLNLLEAMGVDVATEDAIAKEAYRLDVEPWKHWFSPLTLAPSGDQTFFEINLHPDHLETPLRWVLEGIDGKLVRKGAFHGKQLEVCGEYVTEGVIYTRRKAPLGGLGPNYYRLTVMSEDVSETTMLAVYPSTVHTEEWSESNEKVWGVIIQLYTLNSDRNWGFGDFTDLRELIELAAEKGADVIGLNPLHALSPWLEDYYSPYSPSDRRFICPLYIDPYWIPEFNGAAKKTVNQELLAEVRASRNIDYVKIRALKYPVFQTMFEVFIEKELKAQSNRASIFKSFVQDQSSSLVPFAYYEACHQEWPDAKFVLRFGEKLENLENDLFADEGEAPSGAQLAILFHCYLQWLAEEQLEACQTAAKKSGMKVGLIRDLAVGADGGGSEVDGNKNLFCNASSIGAPPDPFAQTGQNWGLPPIIPSEMRKSGFKHFIELLKSNMQHCGALRIDHAMSLMRLWWCPPGKTANYGAYVYYPFHEMLGLLCLESYLNKCLIIGEDLGVVPNEFRDALSRTKIFSNKVFYFEKEGAEFKHPNSYLPHSLAMVNNHDVPTLVSWWNGTDLELRSELDLLEEGISYDDICVQRKNDKEKLLGALFENDVYPKNWHGRSVDEPIDEMLIESILILGSKVASKIFVLQLEDLIMMEEPVNVPGTFKEHANWQRKLKASTTSIFKNPRVAQLLDKVNQQR